MDATVREFPQVLATFAEDPVDDVGGKRVLPVGDRLLPGQALIEAAAVVGR
jgi:hypothetical protein